MIARLVHVAGFLHNDSDKNVRGAPLLFLAFFKKGGLHFLFLLPSSFPSFSPIIKACAVLKAPFALRLPLHPEPLLTCPYHCWRLAFCRYGLATEPPSRFCSKANQRWFGSNEPDDLDSINPRKERRTLHLGNKCCITCHAISTCFENCRSLCLQNNLNCCISKSSSSSSYYKQS